jgi:hypothetical protein
VARMRSARAAQVATKTDVFIREQLLAVQKLDVLIDRTDATSEQKRELKEYVKCVRGELEHEARRLALLSHNETLVKTSLMWLSYHGAAEDVVAIQQALDGSFITGAVLRKEAKDVVATIRASLAKRGV